MFVPALRLLSQAWENDVADKPRKKNKLPFNGKTIATQITKQKAIDLIPETYTFAQTVDEMVVQKPNDFIFLLKKKV